MKKTIIMLSVCALSFLSGCEKKTEVPKNETKQLTIWSTNEKKFLEALGMEFGAELKDPKIQIKVTEFSNEESLHTAILNTLAENNGPDIVYTDGTWIKENPKKFIPLEDEDSPTLIENFKTNFISLSTEQLIQNKKLYGIPFSVETLALIYNQEYLKNIETDTTSLKTWKNIADTAQKLTQKDNSPERFALSGVALGLGKNITHSDTIIENMLMQTVGSFFSDDKNQAIFAQKQEILDTGEKINPGLLAIQFFTNFANASAPNFSWNDVLTKNKDKLDLETFAQGKVAIIFGNAEDIQTIQKIIAEKKKLGLSFMPEANIGIAFLPNFKETTEHRTKGDLSVLGVLSSTKNKNLSWQFLKFAMKKENLQAFADLEKLPSANIEILLEQESNPDLAIFVRQARSAISLDMPIQNSEWKNALKNFLANINPNDQGSLKKNFEIFETQCTEIRQNEKIGTE